MVERGEVRLRVGDAGAQPREIDCGVERRGDGLIGDARGPAAGEINDDTRLETQRAHVFGEPPFEHLVGGDAAFRR